MDSRVATALAKGSAKEAANGLIGQLNDQLGGEAPKLVMAFASTSQPLAELLPQLAAAYETATVLGASTAGEFTERGDEKGSVSAVAVSGDFEVFAGMGTGLKADVEGAVRQAVANLPDSREGYPHRTAILLLDPLSGTGEEATLVAASMLGEGVRLAGGAAGDDLGMKQTHVGLGDRTGSDAVVVATVFSKKAWGVGVCHGHEPVSDVVRVTKAEGGVVHEIDGRPAWDVWAEKTKEVAATVNLNPDELADDQIGSYLLRFEAGLATGDKFKIRAPLSKNDDGSLNFACGIPEGAEVRITESVPQRQIDSAREAARNAHRQAGGGEVAGAIVFDCICRNLILGDQFKEAVTAMSDELGKVPLAGFETYGEIALDAGDMSGFHNTTTVVLTVPK